MKLCDGRNTGRSIAKTVWKTEEIQTMDQKEQMQFFYEIFDSSLPRLGPAGVLLRSD